MRQCWSERKQSTRHTFTVGDAIVSDHAGRARRRRRDNATLLTHAYTAALLL